MKTTCTLIIVLWMALAACAVIKPPSRVTLGMTPEEVEALVGPPIFQSWLYQRPNEKIEVVFIEGRASQFRRSHLDASGDRISQGWSADGVPYWRMFTKGRVTHVLDDAPPGEMPVLNGDPPAKVVKLYGPPPIMYQEYSVDPLRGTFHDGKLTEWLTTPRPPPIP